MKRLWFCLFCVCVVHFSVAAHVLDQYLQVAQIALAPDGVRVELRLIPGIQVAEQVCAQMDGNGDGQVTTAEQQAYARRVLQDMKLAINDVNTPLTLTDAQFPTQQEMRTGLGTIRLTLTAAATLSAADNQQLYFRNNHLPSLGVYLVNALVPTATAIKISRQERDPLQHEMRLSFQVTATDKSRYRSWTGALMFCLCLLLLLPQWKRLRQFLRRANDEKIYAKKIVS